MTARIYPHLFRPGRIGTLETRNRLIMCPMGEGLAHADGSISETQVNYYGQRARGGVGLVVIGSAVVAYPRGAFAANMTAISDPVFLPGLARLSARVHAHGARIAAQLVHDGQYALEDVAAGRPLLMPSPPDPPKPDRLALLVTPEEIAARAAPFQALGARLEYQVATDADLAWVVERFVAAARLAREAGFDGVELHAGHGYLIDSFLSPAMNRRLDRWGGSTANRARLLCDIVASIRAEMGRDFPVWCRLNALERFVEGGETLADSIAVARLAIDAGLDAVHVTVNANPAMGLTATAGHTPSEPGALLNYAAAVKTAVVAPVIAFGRLTPDAAEQALASGKADFIAMGRKLLADPDLPHKLETGAAEEVRPCVYQYRCIGNLYSRSHVSCVVNPETGHEEEEDAPKPIRSARRPVLVVGGGPAGMEAARRLALAGIDVVLAEMQKGLGGMLGVGARADPDLQPLLDWLKLQVARSGVDVRLGTKADHDLLRVLRPQAVIVAAGARWLRPAIPGGDLPLVSTPWEERWTEPGRAPARIAVIGGSKAGMSIAAAIARRGGKAIVLERGAIPAPELSFPARALWADRLDQLGVQLVCGAEVRKIAQDGVTWLSPADGTNFTPVDLVVAADRIEPVGNPFDDPPPDVPIFQIGECADRFIESAMQGAAMAAKALLAQISEGSPAK